MGDGTDGRRVVGAAGSEIDGASVAMATVLGSDVCTLTLLSCRGVRRCYDKIFAIDKTIQIYMHAL